VWNAFSTARLGTLGFDLLRGRRSMARLTNSMWRTAQQPNRSTIPWRAHWG